MNAHEEFQEPRAEVYNPGSLQLTGALKGGSGRGKIGILDSSRGVYVVVVEETHAHGE